MRVESNSDRIESTYVSNGYWASLMSYTDGTKHFLTTSLQFGLMCVLEYHHAKTFVVDTTYSTFCCELTKSKEIL